MALQFPYEYITKLCRQQADTQDHENKNVRYIGYGET
jgi:hypothetical protein